MKIGDFALNKKLIKEAVKALENMSADQQEELKIVTKGSGFIASMIIEVCEAEMLTDLKISDQHLSELILKMLGNGVAVGVLNIAAKSSDTEMFINLFKHFFELTIQQFTESKKC